MSAEEPSSAVEVHVDVSKEVQSEELQPEEKEDTVPTDSMVEQMAPEFEGKPESSEDSGAPSKAYFSKTQLYAAVATFVVIVIVTVVSIAVASAPQPTIRKYYISTEDVEWNYAPQGHDVCSGKPFKYPATKFTNRRYGNTSGFDNRIGTTYLKARFVEYSDATFTVRANRTSDWDHLGKESAFVFSSKPEETGWSNCMSASNVSKPVENDKGKLVLDQDKLRQIP